MTRSIPAPLLAALEGSPLAGECLVLLAGDGTVAGFTTLDEAQVLDLTGVPGAPAAPVTCGLGMNLSAITLAAGLDSSFAELDGPLVGVGEAGLTQAQVRGGKWNDALAWLAMVSPGEDGYAPLLHGRVREARDEDDRFVLQIRNQTDNLNQNQEETVSAFCRWTFGDPDTCGYDLEAEALPCTVTAVTDALRFTVSYAGTFATGWFNRGKARFASGELDGVTGEPIHLFTSLGAGSGTVVMNEPLVAVPQLGDTLDLLRGCPKVRPACMGFHGNARPFGAEPDAPGRDVFLYPNVPSS